MAPAAPGGAQLLWVLPVGGRLGFFVRFRKPRRVTGHGVDLEIQQIASLAFAPSRDFECVPNDQHVELIAVDRVDG